MGMDVWFKEDIRNILFSINTANADIADYADDPQVMAYRRGYLAALIAMAAAFGISLMDPIRGENYSASLLPVPPTLRLTG